MKDKSSKDSLSGWFDIIKSQNLRPVEKCKDCGTVFGVWKKRCAVCWEKYARKLEKKIRSLEK